MKKLLFIASIIFLLIFSSCSQSEYSIENSISEKEYLVEQTLIEFNKSAIKTGAYSNLVASVSDKSSTGQLSQFEVDDMIQDFLSIQTQEFLDVYYKLEALNLTEEEFFSIANQFKGLKQISISNNLEKGPAHGGGCATSRAITPFTFLGVLGKFVFC